LPTSAWPIVTFVPNQALPSDAMAFDTLPLKVLVVAEPPMPAVTPPMFCCSHKDTKVASDGRTSSEGMRHGWPRSAPQRWRARTGVGIMPLPSRTGRVRD
jgi:hypothetical protein